MTGANNQGLEGLTFIPNTYLPENMNQSESGGLFFAALQRRPVAGGDVRDDYLIYAFDVNLNYDPAIEQGEILNWWGIPVPANTPLNDVSDLHFNHDTGTLFVLYDASDRLIEMNLEGEVLRDYTQVSRNQVTNQEGIVIITDQESAQAELYIGSDTDKMVGHLSGFPVNYYDGDNDGTHQFIDCNDNDASVAFEQTFYQDLDEDGLGSDVEQTLCSANAPEGYVANSDDDNDIPEPPAPQIIGENGVNIITDANMEAAELNPWRTYGNPVSLEKFLDESKNSQVLRLETDPRGGAQYTRIPVIAGHTYELSYDIKVERGNVIVRLGNESSNRDFENVYHVDRQSNTYQTVTRRFVAPESRDFRVIFSTKAQSEIYIDNVSIVEVQSNSLLSDGGFEAASPLTWRRYGREIQAKSYEESFSGSQSLSLSTPLRGGVQKTGMTIEAGRRYRLEANYKVDSGRLLFLLGDRSSNTDFQSGQAEFLPQIRQSYKYSTRGEWQNYSREFTATENSDDFRLVMTIKSGTAWVDNVTLVEVQ